MAFQLVPGQTDWRLVRDKDAHRDYRVKFLVRGETTDGPALALQTPGLPTYGQEWAIDDDLDIWAWCRWDTTVNPVHVKEPGRFFEVEMLFSTKPDANCCKTRQIEDPLLEPMKVNIQFQKYSEEAAHDRFGRSIKYSSHEIIQGQQTEFDATRFQVSIEQNVHDLELPLVCALRDAVNDAELWGMQRRCVKLTNFSAEKKYFGICQHYFTRHFEFEARYDGFDRDILDQGTKVLSGHWDKTDQGLWVLDNINGVAPDKDNPNHFIRSTDQAGNLARIVLDGNGSPAQKNDELGTVIINTTALLDGTYNPTGQPTSDSILQIDLTDAPPSLDLVTITIFGKRTVVTGTTVDFLETVYVGHGAVQCRTTAQFHSVGLVLVSTQGVAESIGDTFKITAVDVKHGPGTIHVEKYNEGNLLLLGIPTDLEE